MLDPLKGVEHNFVLMRVVCGATFFSVRGDVRKSDGGEEEKGAEE